jgi:hypothetical protein
MAISIDVLLQSIILARALFVAADLNIAEHLALKAMTADEIAIVTHTEASSLKRLLYFLELNDVFEKQDDERYHLTDFSQTMCSNDPHTIKPFLLHDDETRWNCFGNLGHSIATGKASFDKLYGMDYFKHLKQHPLLSARFNDAMTIISSEEDALIAKTIPFKNRVVDIGGGTGQLINNIARTHALTEGILFDLPEVVAQADNLHQTCTKKGGSFFEPIACTADIFILKRVLHDWDDAESLKILKNVTNAMQEGSTLYIIDGILDYSEDKKLLAAIDLALLTIFQGRERTKAEFEALTQAAGLEIVSIQLLGSLMCAIECRKN